MRPLATMWLLLFLPAPLIVAADSDFLKVFPASPAIPSLTYTGQLTYTQTYTASGSTWAAGLDEHEVFFASLKHAEASDTSWEVRLGKGGQLYSIRGIFGESQVSNGTNQTAPFSANEAAAAPSFLLPASSHYVVAEHPDGSLLGRPRCRFRDIRSRRRGRARRSRCTEPAAG